MSRRLGALLVLALLMMPLVLSAQQHPSATSVIFVTIDGVRPEDLFGGVDPTVMADLEGSGIDDTTAFRERWWRESREGRRRAVMPFLWDTLVPMGVLVGDPLGQATVRVTNGLQFSGPGYIELFTGHARAEVTSNDDRRYPYRTVFEVVADRPDAWAGDVAAFTSWTSQARFAASAPGRMMSNAPFDPVPPMASAADRRMSVLEARVRHEDGSMRYDAFTQERALRWLAAHHPVLLHVGFGETDHDAHARRYDHTIAMLHTTDRMLSELWHAAQADPAMAGRTVMVVTTDHGRGATARDWTDHGRDVANAARWWFLAAGAGVTPQGVVDRPMTQSQVAPTILMLLGLDAAGLTAPAAAPARDVIAPGS